jgi:hypothetical protein
VDTVSRLLLTGFLIFVITAIAQPAAAQSEPPSLSIAAGAGIAVPFHSDFSFDAFAWQASIRGRATRHFLIEGMLDQWRHTTTSRRTNVPLLGPSGPIGHIDELTTETLDTMTAVGVNLLGTGTVGRVRISGGGGPGFLFYYDRHTTTLVGCSAPSPSICEGRTNSDGFLVFAAHGVADVDVALTRHVSAVGRVLMAVPVEDPGYGHLNATAGLRVSFR